MRTWPSILALGAALFLTASAVNAAPSPVATACAKDVKSVCGEVERGRGNGMMVTAGGFNGGYGLYLLNGKPVFDYNMLMLAQVRCEGPL